MRSGVIIVASVLGCTALQAQAPRLEGVWRVTEVTVTGDSGYTDTSPQPSLCIFTKKYYSILTINTRGPRPAYDTTRDPTKLTDADKIARFEQWDHFTANSGTYEVSDSVLTTHPTVAKSDRVIGSTGRRRYRFEGRALWLISPRTDAAGEVRAKLTRLE